MKRIKKQVFLIGLMLLMLVTTVGFVSCQTTNSFTYSFVVNGGAEIADLTIETGETYTLPVPTQSGYEFDGWYDNANFSGDPITTVTASENATYYAKWSKLCVITLDLDGGSLNQTTLYLKEGANVYEYMQAYVPKKEGLEFGEWYNGSSKLLQTLTMPAEGLTLTAKYKVAYTVELYEQKITLDGYEKSETVITGYEYVGTTFESEPQLTGFREVQKDDTVTTRVLSENASENVFVHYFDRETYTVSLRLTYPDGTVGLTESKKVLYGTALELPMDYRYTGYYLLGWSTTPNGDVVYDSDYLQCNLQNAEQAEGDGTSLTIYPDRTTSLYTVWLQGYTDMFGGGDCLYILDDSSNIYLCRGSLFFVGSYANGEDAAQTTFFFRDADGNYLLRGILNENHTFSYRSSDRQQTICKKYSMGSGLDDSITLQFGYYNEIYYVETDENNVDTTLGAGTYTIDENGNYLITFTDHALTGTQMNVMIGEITNDDGSTTWAFQVRNDSEYELGILYMAYATASGAELYTSDYWMMLDGYGYAMYYASGDYSYYYYTMDEDGTVLLLDTTYYYQVDAFRIIEVNGVTGYMPYDVALDFSEELDSGAKLTLDGMYQGTYTDENGVVSKGYFSVSDSMFSGYIVSLTGTNDYTFLVLVEAIYSDDASSVEYRYQIEQKNVYYMEFLYQENENTEYAPLLVIDGTEAEKGDAYLYALNDKNEYVKASWGSYVYNEETERYVYTTKGYTDETFVSDYEYLLETESFVFGVGLNTSSYYVMYWFSAKDTNGGTTEYGTTYTAENGDTLLLIGGFAYYTKSGKTSVGYYSYSDNLLMFYESDYIYMELDQEAMRFVVLNESPYYIYYMAEDQSVSETEYLYIDGKGGAQWTIDSTVYNGTISQLTDKSVLNWQLYRFRSDDGTQEFTYNYVEATSGAVYYARYNDTYHGTYTGNDGVLIIDGYSVWAKYTDANNEIYESMYYISDAQKGIVCLRLSDGDRYVKLDNEDSSFMFLGTEYGIYMLLDNLSAADFYFEMDGLGGLSVFCYQDGTRVDLTTGTYKALTDGLYRVAYALNGKQEELVGILSTYHYTLSGGSYDYDYEYPVFIVAHDEVVCSFFNEKNWTVLILDAYGNAALYDEEGFVEEGTYKLITDSLFYYVNADNTDATLYSYSVADGVATVKQFTAAAYFTEDLQSLSFTKYGYAVEDGESYYYYDIVEKEISGEIVDVIVIYIEGDETSGVRNEYGFYTVEIPCNDDFIEYKNVKYYKSVGAIDFERTDAASRYCFTIDGVTYTLGKLVFTPSGGMEFAIDGTLYLSSNGSEESNACSIVREAVGDDYVTYISYDIYRFYVNLTYKGSIGDDSKCSYSVNGMTIYNTVYAGEFWDMYALLSSFGYDDSMLTFLNGYGQLTFVKEFDEDGAETRSYLSGAFSGLSKMYDSLGNVVSFEKEIKFENSVTLNRMYEVSFTAEDGKIHTLYFWLEKHDDIDVYCYRIFAFTRTETVTVTDGDMTATLTVEKVIRSEYDKDSEGYLYSVNELLINGKAADLLSSVVDGHTAYCYVKTDAGIVRYCFTLKEGTASSSDVKPPYIDSTDERICENCETHYTKDGDSYVVTLKNGEKTEIALIYRENVVYRIEDCTYDEASGVYTVTAKYGYLSTCTFAISFNGSEAVISEIAEV